MTQSRSLPHAAFAWWMRQRWLVRAPIWLFRARLGFAFGSRLLMVEHTGRKTGARRYVVVEVIGRPRPGTYIVPALPRAQWYRNIQANSSVLVSVGGRHLVPATARPLTVGQKQAVLDGYAQRHPRMWAAMGSVFEDILEGPPAEAPMLALELRKQAWGSTCRFPTAAARQRRRGSDTRWQGGRQGQAIAHRQVQPSRAQQRDRPGTPGGVEGGGHHRSRPGDHQRHRRHLAPRMSTSRGGHITGIPGIRCGTLCRRDGI